MWMNVYDFDVSGTVKKGNMDTDVCIIIYRQFSQNIEGEYKVFVQQKKLINVDDNWR